MTAQSDRGRKARNGSHDGPRIDRQSQDRIGQELQAMYQELIEEPIPDRILDVLRALEARDEPSET